MPDPRFFRAVGPFSLADLADVAEARVRERDDPARLLHDVAPLDQAGPDQISFLDNQRYAGEFRTSGAGACVVRPERADEAPVGMAILESDEPYLAYARIARAFYPEEIGETFDPDAPPIDPTAVVDRQCAIAPGAVVGARAEIGAGSVIGPNAVVGPGVVIGEDCHIGACATVHYCIMGNRVRLYSGARIGEAGFGFAPSRDGYLTVPQLGRVMIGDDVEVGANSTIDRGAGPDTIIGNGCRIDNLVQIGHNVKLGAGCILVAQTGISGSTTLEDQVVIGGQGGLVGHIRIGRGAQIGAQAGVMNDVPAGARYGGTPAQPVRHWLRQTAVLKRISERNAKEDG